MKKHAFHGIAIALLALVATGAQAQQAGSWLGRVGVTTISPDVSSGDLSAPSLPHTQIDVNSNTQLSGGITYMLTDNWALDLPLALPYKHTISGAGAISGAGKLGDVRALPITLFAQYRFLAANAQARPYVGVGATYAKFYDERSTGTLSALTGGSPTTFEVDSKWAPTFQAGLQYMINDKVFLDGMVAKTLLKTTTHLSTGQSIDAKLDPWTISLSVGMKFR